MINIVDGFQRKAIEIMNNVDDIIKVRSTLDLRKIVFSNRSIHTVWVTVQISSATPHLLLIQ